jgi:hypothetical protein
MSKRILPALLILVVAGLSTSKLPGKDLEFRGWPVKDSETGFTIIKTADATVIANLQSQYVVTIPPATIWKFQVQDAQHLSGDSSRYLVTVSLDSTSSKSPNEELERILANLKHDEAFSIEESEVVSTPSAPVLRYRNLARQVPKEHEKLNDWQWHYWSATAFSGRWATVHVSLKQLGVKLKASEDEKVITALAPAKAEGK